MVANTPSEFDKFNSSIAGIAEKITAGSHAAPEAGVVGLATVPSRHRLYNALGGIGGWIVGRHIMNVMVGETPSGKKVEKEKVNPALRPFYGILAYNRYADDPKNQWMRVIDDLTPAIIGSVGGVLGSQYFFAVKEAGYLSAVGWGSKHKSMTTLLADKSISSLAKENFVSLQQAKTWRVLSGVAGIFAASSGIALLVAPFNILNYGVSLNNAFALANGVIPGGNLFKKTPLLRWIANTTANTSYAPASAARAMVNNVSNCVAEMESLGKVVTAEGIKEENFGRITEFTNAIVRKMFPNVTEKGVEEFRASIMKAIDKAVADAKKDDPTHIAKHVKAELEKIFTKDHGIGLDHTIEKLSKDIGKQEFGEIKYGNHGFSGWLGNHPKTAYGVAATALMGTNAAGELMTSHFASKAHEDISPNARQDIGDMNKPLQVAAPEKPGSAISNFVNGPALRAGRWLSDSVLNVPPQNRLFSALGLSGGLWVGYRAMRAIAQKDFNGMPLGKDAKIDPVLKWCTDKLRKVGVKLDFKYFVNTPDNRIKRAAFWLIPTATALVGTYMGSRYAFRNHYKNLEHPEFLEDYTAKIAMTQGDKWGWLLSTAGVMASSSGFSNLPIPGINYSISLSTRSVLSYDKKVTLPGMKWWSNNKSNYYFGLKGALDYTVLYAVRNPSEYPQELAPLAEATLQPLFPDVTKEQIAQYVNKIQEVRNKYWQEGVGIPPEKQEAAKKELKSMLRGAGFEKTLTEIGLDPAKAVFDNGAAGKIADMLGAKKHVTKLAEEYRQKFQARHKATETAPAAETAAEPVKSFAEKAPKKRSPLEEVPTSASHAEKYAKAETGKSPLGVGM